MVATWPEVLRKRPRTCLGGAAVSPGGASRRLGEALEAPRCCLEVTRQRLGDATGSPSPRTIKNITLLTIQASPRWARHETETLYQDKVSYQIDETLS